MTRAAARRFLLTLAKLGYVGTDKKTFWLRSRVLELGYSYLSSQPWWQVAQPVLEEAGRQTQETCNIAILSDTEIVYVARVIAKRIISTNLASAHGCRRMSPHSGGCYWRVSSPTELKELVKRVKLTRFTSRTVDDKRSSKRCSPSPREWLRVVDQELELGLLALAVPIRSPSGGILAALGVSVGAGRDPGAARQTGATDPAAELRPDHQGPARLQPDRGGSEVMGITILSRRCMSGRLTQAASGCHFWRNAHNLCGNRTKA